MEAESLPEFEAPPKRLAKLLTAVNAVEDPMSLDVLKKFLISVTNMYILNLFRFLGTSSLMLSGSNVACLYISPKALILWLKDSKQLNVKDFPAVLEGLKVVSESPTYPPLEIV